MNSKTQVGKLSCRMAILEGQDYLALVLQVVALNLLGAEWKLKSENSVIPKETLFYMLGTASLIEKVHQKKSCAVTIGAITDGIPFYPITPGTVLSIPDGEKSTEGATPVQYTFDIPTYFFGSTKFTLTVISGDESWKSVTPESGITFSISDNTLTADVLRPIATEEIPATIFKVRGMSNEEKTLGEGFEFDLPVGKVTI